MNGDGPTVGQAISAHPGQSCNAPTRMLVPTSRHDEAVAIAKAVAETITVGDPFAEGYYVPPTIFANVRFGFEELLETRAEMGWTAG